MRLTLQSEVGAIQRLIVKHSRDAFESDDAIKAQWRELHYEGPPDFARAEMEYDEFAELLQGFEIETHFLPNTPGIGLDSIYVRDAVILCDKGAILCNMGKKARKAEPAAQASLLSELGMPIVGSITGSGSVEGGDVAWIDERTLAVGRGYRTNDDGLRQLREFLGDSIDELIVVPLPHWRGPTDVFHLMSILSPIDVDLSLVYSPLMPIPFREALLERGIELVEVPEAEFVTMGINVLTVAPRVCVMLAGNPETKRRLERAGAFVHEFEGREICAKGAGGPTCLTRPIERAIR
ncbi:dimethylarginine dimethylaminohydrolase family protein [Gemmatimonadota bacterium]